MNLAAFSGVGFDLVPWSPLNSVQIPASPQREPDDIFLLGLRVQLRRILGEAFAGTNHRFSGFSQPCQCGDDVLRMLVAGGPPVRGGGGIPQRIRVISVPVSLLRITGAG
jgi:hypothetical protein